MLLRGERGVAVGTSGLQLTVAPAGRPVTEHVAAAAGLGPLLVHVNVPLTVLPAVADEGKLVDADMSAATTISNWTWVGAPAGR